MTQKVSQATIMTGLALDSGATFFHTPGYREYVAIQRNGHVEVLPLKGGAVRRWLSSLYRQETGGVPGSQALQDALTALQGFAIHEGDEEDVYVRVARHEGDIYIDLGNSGWQAVRVSANGWEVVDVPPVYFRRMRGALPLPVPKLGDARLLDPFLNVIDPDDLRLVKTVGASYLFPDGPYVVLIFQGEQGAAKSFTARLMRAFIDPSSAPLRTMPRDERDLMIAASNSWVQSFDNVSYIKPWMSDALCRLASGTGFATRELYSDDEEAIFDAARPIILNGISSFVTRGDLADRSITITLPAVAETKRKTDEDILAAFDRARPHIFGGVLDLIVKSLKNEGATAIDRLPRMATFARRGYAMAPALGWTGNDFMITYKEKIRESGREVLEASPIAGLIIEMIEKADEWTGTATDLLEQLSEDATETMKRSRSWPKAANALSNELKRLVPVLRGHGIEVVFDRTGRRRHIIIRRVEEKTVTIVTTPDFVSGDGDDGVTMDDGKQGETVTKTVTTPGGDFVSETTPSDDDDDDDDDDGLVRTHSNGDFDLAIDDEAEPDNAALRRLRVIRELGVTPTPGHDAYAEARQRPGHCPGCGHPVSAVNESGVCSRCKQKAATR